MKRRHKIGILLLGLIPLVGVAILALDVKMFQAGPAAVLEQSSTPSASEEVVLIPFTPNWAVLLPLALLIVLLAVTGLACLLVPAKPQG
jgi:hypothetical protein